MLVIWLSVAMWGFPLLEVTAAAAAVFVFLHALFRCTHTQKNTNEFNPIATALNKCATISYSSISPHHSIHLIFCYSYAIQCCFASFFAATDAVVVVDVFIFGAVLLGELQNNLTICITWTDGNSFKTLHIPPAPHLCWFKIMNCVHIVQKSI